MRTAAGTRRPVNRHCPWLRWSTGLLLCLVCLAPVPAETDGGDYDYCLVCHGSKGNGNPVLRAPKISGLRTWYIENQLHAFAAGFRGTRPDDAAGAEMRAILRMLDDPEQIRAAAAFIGELESKDAPATVQGDIERGRELYRNCAVCHGSRAEGNRALQAPNLAIQSDWYLVKQIRDYRSGARGTHPDDLRGAQMRPMVQLLPDDKAIHDVIAYIKRARPQQRAGDKRESFAE